MTAHARCERVKRVVLEVGKLTAVLPDAIRFCFDVCSAETVAEGAELEIVETPGQARCRACGRQMIVEESFGYCRCGRVRHGRNSIIIRENELGLSVGVPRSEPFFADEGMVLLGRAWPHHD